MNLLIRSALKYILQGLLFSLGGLLLELVKRRFPTRSPMSRLLFHPKVTFSAMCFTLASFCTLIASLAVPLQKVPFIGKYSDPIVGTAMVVGPIAVWIATYGRSPASAVDNNVQPK